MRKWRDMLAAAGIAMIVAGPSVMAQTPAGPAFTYQGRLTDGGIPASAVYDLNFRLFDASTGGTQIGAALCVDNLSVTDGLFTVSLDFGAAAFDGDQRFLEIQVRADTGLNCGIQTGFVTLAPRQPLSATPYATYATGNWGLSGNAGTGAASFLGTTDNVPLELRVDNQRVLRMWYAEDGAPPLTKRCINMLGGSPLNEIGPGVVGGTVAGGGVDYLDIADAPNRVLAHLGTVSGGQGNTADFQSATVAGGEWNTASGWASAISGGRVNSITGHDSAIPGGVQNRAAGWCSFAAGNRASAAHDHCFVWSDGGGYDFMETTGPSQFLIEAAGGVGINTNSPGTASLAVNGGLRARGGPPGAFGVNNNGYAFAGNGGDEDSGLFSLADGTLSLFTNSEERLRVDPTGNVAIGTTEPLGFMLEVNGTAAKPGGGTWAYFCDARLKTNIAPLTGTLDRLLSLHGYEFDYTPEAVESRYGLPGRQIGLIAQEVQGVFPDWVDCDDAGYLHVTERATTALLVEALRDLRAEKDAQLAARDAEITALRKTVGDLAERLADLERRVSSRSRNE